MLAYWLVVVLAAEGESPPAQAEEADVVEDMEASGADVAQEQVDEAMEVKLDAPNHRSSSWSMSSSGLKDCDGLEDPRGTSPTEAPPRGTKGCGWVGAGTQKLAIAVGKKGGRWFVIDTNGDGRWSDETPLFAERDEDGDYEVQWSHTLQVDGVEVPMEVALAWDKGFLRTRWATTRQGMLGDRSVQLRPSDGRYDVRVAYVGIDVDGDGSILGLESRRVSAGWFRIDGVDYALVVDPAGDTLTLTPGERPDPVLELGAPAPEFELTDIDGKAQSLAAHEGRWVLIDFWATWCGPCVANLPALEELVDAHADVLDVVGIAPDEEAKLRPFCEKRGMDYPQVVIDWGDPVMEAYQVGGVPTYVLVDPEGALAAVGPLSTIEAALPGE